MTVATLALKGAHVEISADRQTWKPLAAKAGDGMAAVSIALKDLSADRKVYLRVKQGRG